MTDVYSREGAVSSNNISGPHDHRLGTKSKYHAVVKNVVRMPCDTEKNAREKKEAEKLVKITRSL